MTHMPRIRTLGARALRSGYSTLAIPLVLAAPVAALGAAAEPARLPAAGAAAATIDAATLSAHVRFLASDLLEGRGPGGRGDELTRAYLAAVLESLGYAPGAEDGTYQQRFEMVGLRSTAPESWAFRAAEQTVTLARTADFMAFGGVQSGAAELADAELVFAGYGIEAPEYDWNDFKDADLAGKVLLLLNSDPDWDPQLFAGTTRLYYGRWTYKFESAARKGAAGAIILHTTSSAGYPWQVVQSSWGGEQFELPDAGGPRLAVKAWTTEDATRRLLAAAGHDLDALVASARSRAFRPVPLGIRTTLRLDLETRRIETANVLGLLRGRDPEKAGEVVVFSAHHDHLGIAQPDAEGDAIYNGAIDNATGIAQLLAIARAVTALPERPRRSILFAFVAAEEQGLLGSNWYAEHPTFPPGRIAANINLDAGNVFGRTADVTYIGYGKSSLDRVIEAAAARQQRKVKPDTMPDRGFFYRSDQFNFARIGVPALYIDGGKELVGKDADFGRQLQERYESTCYHQPCDEMADDWDYSALIEDAQLAFDCALTIAEDEAMPTWNAGDEFEAARLRAVAELPGRAGSR